MPFRYTGDFDMVYPQYFDEATDRPLLASPGGVYEMRPAGNLTVPVPPQDGRWQAVSALPPPPPAPVPVTPPAAPQPVPEPPAPSEPAPDVTGDDPAQPA